MTTEKLTVEQAIEKGYTHFIEEEGERLEKFSSLDDFNKERFKTKICFLVDMSAPYHYSLSADAIRDIIADHVAGQEDVIDDDDKTDIAAWNLIPEIRTGRQLLIAILPVAIGDCPETV